MLCPLPDMEVFQDSSKTLDDYIELTWMKHLASLVLIPAIKLTDMTNQ